MAKEQFSVYQNALTEDTNPDGTADFFVTYDTSAATSKKVKLQTLGNPSLQAVNMTASVSQTLSAGYALYVPYSFEIAAGVTFEIGAGAVLEIG